jgi:hypothetical protein
MINKIKIDKTTKNFYGIKSKQKPKLSICPHCKERFYYYQIASEHARMFKHFGDYNV